MFFCKHVYLGIDTALCPRLLSKLSLYGDIYLHLESSNSTNRSTTYDYQLLPIKDKMSYLSLTLCSSLMHSTRALMLLSVVCTGTGTDNLNEQF